MAAAIPALIAVAAAAAAATPSIVGAVATSLAITASVASVLITFAGTILATVVGGLLAPKPKTQEATFGDQRQVIRQAVPARQYVLGRVRVGGAVAFYDTSPSASQRLYSLVVHAAHQCNAVSEWWVGDTVATLSGGASGNVTVPAIYNDIQAGSVSISYAFGTAAQTAPALLTAEFPSSWTSDHRLRGLMYSITVYTSLPPATHYQVFQSGPPAVRPVLEGALCYDPREVSHDNADPTTWAYTTNAALLILWYLTYSEGSGAIPAGFGFPFASIDEDSFASAANVCDEAVDLKAGGTEARWRISGAFTGDEERRAVLNALLAACEGRLLIGPDGTIGLDVGTGTAPTTNASIVDQDIIEYQETTPEATERANVVTASIVSEAHDWQVIEVPPARDTAAIALVGREEPLQLPLRFCPSASQAQRIEVATLRRASPTFAGTLTTTLAGLAAWGERWINVTLSELDFDGVCEVQGMILNRDTMTVTLQVVSYDGWWSWDETTDELDVTALPSRAGGASTIPAPASVSASVSTRYIDALTTAPAIVLTWTNPGAAYATEVRWKKVGGTYAYVQLDAGTTSWTLFPAEQDEDYDMGVRHVGAGGNLTDWQNIGSAITATGDATAPTAVSDLAASDVSGDARLTWTAPTSANAWRARVYRHTASVFGSASEVTTTPIYLLPGESLTYTDVSPGSGTFYYWVTTENFSAVASSESNTASITF